MRDLFNGNLLIVLIMTMVISCSASRSITTIYSKQVEIVQQDSLIEQLDSTPSNKLKPDESKVKSGVINQIVINKEAVNKEELKDLIDKVNSSNEMIVDMYNNWVNERLEKDSLLWANKAKEAHIRELVNKQNEEAEIGQVILDSIKTTSQVGLGTIIVFGSLAIVLIIILLLKRNAKIEFDKLKSCNG